jgi:hypothetical protein
MPGGSHVPIAARSRELEGPHPFRQNRVLPCVEDGIPPVHLNPEGVAFHSAEIRTIRAAERRTGSDAVLNSDARARLGIALPPLDRRLPFPNPGLGGVGDQVRLRRLFQLAENDGSVPVEEGFARRHRSKLRR